MRRDGGRRAWRPAGFPGPTGSLALAGLGLLGVVASGLAAGCGWNAPAIARPEPAPSPALSRLEASIVDVLNLVRADPPGFAASLELTRTRYEGLLYRISPKEVLMTKEGVAALDDALAALKTAAPASHLVVAGGLCLAARDHAEDQSRTGGTGHDGSDGSTFRDRIERHGGWTGSIGENASYGGGTAVDVVARLVIDDGVPDRGHRTTILSGAFRTVGVACAPHPSFELVCVIEFASAFDPSARPAVSSRRKP